MVVTPGGSVFVGEIGPDRVWKFADPNAASLTSRRSDVVMSKFATPASSPTTRSPEPHVEFAKTDLPKQSSGDKPESMEATRLPASSVDSSDGDSSTTGRPATTALEAVTTQPRTTVPPATTAAAEPSTAPVTVEAASMTAPTTTAQATTPVQTTVPPTTMERTALPITTPTSAMHATSPAPTTPVVQTSPSPMDTLDSELINLDEFEPEEEATVVLSTHRTAVTTSSGFTQDQEVIAEDLMPPEDTVTVANPVPTTAAPTTHMPTLQAPTTHVPTIQAPMPHVPTTHAPTTNVPATHAPSTHVPAIHAPSTHAPTTNAPKTQASTTKVAASRAPTVAASQRVTVQKTSHSLLTEDDLKEVDQQKSSGKETEKKDPDWIHSVGNQTIVAAVAIVCILFGLLIVMAMVKFRRLSSRRGHSRGTRRTFSRRGQGRKHVEFQRLDTGSHSESDDDDGV